MTSLIPLLSIQRYTERAKISIFLKEARINCEQVKFKLSEGRQHSRSIC